MSHQLYLLRHSESEPWSPLGNDFSRALSPGGSRHAQRVADWALDNLELPETVLCSPAKRTRQTLAPFLSHWPKLLGNTDYVDSIYNASLNMLLTLAEDAFSYSERLFLVGHNPGVQTMLMELLSEDQDNDNLWMKPGTLAIIEFPDRFRREARDGKLLNFVRKEDLSDD
mgnify:FL=1